MSIEKIKNQEKMKALLDKGWTITPQQPSVNHIQVPISFKRNPYVRKCRALKLVSYWIYKGKNLDSLCRWLGLLMDDKFDIKQSFIDHTTKIEYTK